MAALSAKTYPDLKAAWEEYGFDTAWNDIVDAKVRVDGCYVVFLLKASGKDSFELVDIASDGNRNWDVQNDGSDLITMAQWEKLKIVPCCDWYEYPDDEKMEVHVHDERLETEPAYKKVFDVFVEGYSARLIGDDEEMVKAWLESQTFKNLPKQKKRK